MLRIMTFFNYHQGEFIFANNISVFHYGTIFLIFSTFDEFLFCVLNISTLLLLFLLVTFLQLFNAHYLDLYNQ